MKPRLVLALVLSVATLAGCASMSALDFRDGTPLFEPELFFRGVTRSNGVLEDRTGSPTRRLRVEGEGQVLPDGALRLVQQVTLGDDPPQTRTWVLRRIDAHRLTATLTDASGPVEAEAYGDVVHLRYAMSSPTFGRMEQWMYLQPDGRTVVNEATIRVLGIVVAHLSERITRVDDR